MVAALRDLFRNEMMLITLKEFNSIFTLLLEKTQ